MQLKTIISAEESLVKIGQQDLPSTVSYKLRQLINKVSEHIANFNQEREKLFIKYGEDKGNETYQIKNENVQIFQNEISELLELDIDEVFHKVIVPLDDNIKISVTDINALNDFVEFQEK